MSNPISLNIDHILAIVGPTASGKSNFSLSLCEEAYKKNLTIELISMDSALVYRGMSIGTAKPSNFHLASIKHHGVDICEPWESYSAAKFASDSMRWYQEARDRGHIPVIIGGTMLYWRALTQGLTNLPPADPIIRKKIELDALQHGWDSVYEQLCVVDPISAQRLPPGDTQRISRALEVFLSTGKSFSSWIQEDPYGKTRNDTSINSQLFSFEPEDRKWLHTRIENRFHEMLKLNFLNEVRTLMDNPLINQHLPSMRAVGYRQAWEYLVGEITEDEFINKSIAATRQLAKRQLTWLRAMPTRRVVNPQNSIQVKHAVSDCLNQLIEWSSK
ncbi:MAG: tRNA (adenosine(37)-N6)-dimethylallyltransferase MiaA [Betaproteobacteria bacterium]